MVFRTLIAVAALGILTSPAWADCQQELDTLSQAIVASETGAVESESGMAATKHQQEVLSDNKERRQSDTAAASGQPAGDGNTDGAAAASGTGTAEPVSPHQRDAVRALSGDDRANAGKMLDEARQMAQAGDEQGCMRKVSEIRDEVGMN